MKQRFTTALLVLAGISFFWIDTPLTLFLHSWVHPQALVVSEWLQEIGKSHWILVPCILLTAIFWIRKDKHRMAESVAMFAAVATSGIIANILKVVVCRPRPPLLFSDGLTYPAFFSFNTQFLWNSFPSGHATTGISFAIIATAIVPRYRLLWYAIGLAIAVSRIILQVHYLSDVLVGCVIGMWVAWLCLEHLERFKRSHS